MPGKNVSFKKIFYVCKCGDAQLCVRQFYIDIYIFELYVIEKKNKKNQIVINE